MIFEVVLTNDAKNELKNLESGYYKIAQKDYSKIKDIGIESVNTKHLQDQIFEIKSGRVRSLFGYKEGKQIIVSVIFLKKSQKTPSKLIKLAKERLKNYGK